MTVASVFRSRCFLPWQTHMRAMLPSSTTPYDNWTREELIVRLSELDRISSRQRKTHTEKPFDFSAQPLRKIALKFCYSGWEYNGLAFQEGHTPLPTVEEVLFNALTQTRLVNPDGGLKGCGWERCGRTDCGVSAAGQVISLWVRSALKSNKDVDQGDGEGGKGEPDSRKSELHYVSILNRVLPDTIRVLAWSPVSPDFSARFACRYRHYKYFFSSRGLDLSLMQNAADRLVGEHDFRNLCKLDPAKQITNFKRGVLEAKINAVSNPEGVVTDNTPFVLDLVGTSFLYHQVRHIMAILFLVGTGLEHPSVISALLNVDADHPTKSQGLEVVDRKPVYQMTDGFPLMLWDCGYSDSDVRWRVEGDDELQPQVQHTGSGTELYDQLHSIHERSVIRTTLDAHHLAAAARYHSPAPLRFPLRAELMPLTKTDSQCTMKIPLGGGTFLRTAKYVPLLRRKRLDDVAVANQRWKVGKGARKLKAHSGETPRSIGNRSSTGLHGSTP